MTMQAHDGAARAICLLRRSVDRSRREKDSRAVRGLARASLLTPVAKAFSTDIGNEVASLGIQVHGGMGYIEETGAAQFSATRDRRDLRRHQWHSRDVDARDVALTAGEGVAAHLDRTGRDRLAVDRRRPGRR